MAPMLSSGALCERNVKIVRRKLSKGERAEHTLLYPGLLTLVHDELLKLLLVFWGELREVDVLALIEGGAWLIHDC